MKKKHPTYDLYADENGIVYYENGNKIPTYKQSTRETFVVRKDGKCLNFGLRRFIWECMTGQVLDKSWVIVGKEDSNHINDLSKVSKSEHASNIYKEIWKRKKS